MRASSSIRPVVLFVSLLFAAALVSAARAQQAPGSAAVSSTSNGKVLTLEDYPGWKRIQSAALSPDGRWMSYAYRPNEGDDTLFVRDLDGSTVHSVVRGSAPDFSADSRWVRYTVNPPDGNGGGRGQSGQRGQAPPAPRGQAAANGGATRKLQVLDLSTGAKWEVSDVQSSEFSPDARFLAVHRNRADRQATHEGADLVLRDLRSGTIRNFGNVGAFAFNESGNMLAYTVDAADRAGNGIHAVDLASGTVTSLDTKAEDYRQMAWNEDGTGLVVLRGLVPEKQTHRQNMLLVFPALGRQPTRVEYDPSGDALFPTGHVLSELAAVRWTKDGDRILLGLKVQEPEPPDADEPAADVEVWHWKDEDVQSVQKVRLEQTRRYTYATVFNIASRKLLKLADDAMPAVTFAEEGRWGIGRLDEPYRMELDWGGSRADYYRIDLDTGERELMVRALRRTVGTSPDGKWFIYLKDEKLQLREMATGRTTDLSALASVSFVNVDDDHDYEKPAWGLGGWSEDGRSVILNHRFDLWQFPLGGGKPIKLTAGMGDAEQIRFRVVRTGGGGGRGGGRGGFGGGGAQGIDTSRPILLSAYGEWTKKSGYYEVKPGAAPRPLRFEDMAIDGLQKADSADRVIYTKQTFEVFPDYWVASAKLGGERKVTDANPRIADFAWGRRILVDYTDARGNKLQATLALPANYEPGRRYPMLVYHYEKMSQNHHRFSMPVYDDRPHMSAYASDGYLVLQPDIVYEIGKPGTSALDDVGSAVRKVIELGYADPDRVGLQGHSWGGYQSSFIVTQTDMFAAVVTGAPPTNLVSFYDELYKSSGTVQQGIMEIGQVRMGEGATPWTAHELYESQSPIHQAENITTPFMILHGTDDGSVDWHQGLEYYNAARRLGKEVILLSYPGEGHHLGRQENQKDFQVRMKQFFDHYLKGTPAPKWMTDGVRYIDRNRTEKQARPITPDGVYALLATLSHDSLQGRATGAPGSLKAARIIAAEMERSGLEQAGDSGWYQRLPVASVTRTIRGREITRPAMLDDFAALDTIPAERRLTALNVVGVLRGSDPSLANEHILVGAHYDHVGVRTPTDSLGNPVPGDSIFNGADDDASGVVAMLEIARVLAAGPAPKRTIIFAATTGEETGLLGTRWYIQQPFLPLDQMVADLQIEMIGRPDSLAGGTGKAWLTGYERSTMGEMLAAGGVPIVPDPRPDQRFFDRSDNIAFARIGIPAHTLSTFNLHTDYHRASDEVQNTDPAHMAAVIEAAVQAVRILADGPKPEWKPGGRPVAGGR